MQTLETSTPTNANEGGGGDTKSVKSVGGLGQDTGGSPEQDEDELEEPHPVGRWWSRDRSVLPRLPSLGYIALTRILRAPIRLFCDIGTGELSCSTSARSSYPVRPSVPFRSRLVLISLGRNGADTPLTFRTSRVLDLLEGVHRRYRWIDGRNDGCLLLCSLSQMRRSLPVRPPLI